MQMKIFLAMMLTLLLGSCSKNFLDTKPSTDIIQPSNLADLEKMMENDVISNTPALPLLSGEEYYYFTAPAWQLVSATEQNSYTWAKDVFGGEIARLDWRYPYVGIFYANNVLESLAAMDSAATTEGRKIKGWALFVRAYNHYNLVKNFAPIYNAATANTDLGVPLKLSAPIETLPRSTVQQVYDQILLDLKTARELLLPVLPVNRNQPCRMAVDALLARIGLTMRDYTMAEKHADSCLFYYKTLIYYPNVTTQLPIKINNEETLFASSAVQTYTASRVGANTSITIDTVLLKKYNANDTRFTVVFTRNSSTGQTQTIARRGYLGTTTNYAFTGLATDEVYLVKAECAARRNAIDTCLYYLNTLLVNRYKPGTFTNLTAATAEEAKQLVLEERRKELVWRGLRWDDLARLNKEGANITLTRTTVDGQTYTLLPNSLRYVFNIPADEINLSGIPQNER
jgi:hypothetical protein